MGHYFVLESVAAGSLYISSGWPHTLKHTGSTNWRQCVIQEKEDVKIGGDVLGFQEKCRGWSGYDKGILYRCMKLTWNKFKMFFKLP